VRERDSRRRVTLADVAQHAGFSRSTASLVFQESPLVARDTRETVLSSAEALGYVYDRRAAALRTRRSDTVGLLIPGLVNPFFAALVQAIEEELAPVGLTVLLANSLESPARQEALVTTFLEYRVDGLLIVPAIGSTPSVVTSLDRLGVPHVLLTRKVAGVNADWVGSDDHRGGAIAAEHLLEHGCRRLAYVGGPPEVYARATRHTGFLETVRAADAEFVAEWSEGTATSSSAGYEAARQLLAAGRPPEGLACHSDAIAFGVMRALRDAGARVGEDVRVVGYDDVEHARSWAPSLSSISVSSEAMGRAAARLLTERIGSSDTSAAPRTTVFAPLLRARESCGVHKQTGDERAR
jgi:LacI family transcriptional regulator